MVNSNEIVDRLRKVNIELSQVMMIAFNGSNDPDVTNLAQQKWHRRHLKYNALLELSTQLMNDIIAGE